MADVAEFPEFSTVIEQAGCSVSRSRFSGGLSDGVEVVRISNGRLTVDVLPTRGMGIWQADADGVRIGWDSPVKSPVNPKFVNLESRNKLGWLDGFNELVCRCGLAFNGPPGTDEGNPSPIESSLTLHGRIANTPAHSVEFIYDQSTGEVGVEGIVDEATLFGPQLRLHSRITIKPDDDTFTIVDTVTNLGSSSTELQLLYHTNIGKPFLEPGASAHIPASKVVPRDDRAAEGIESYSSYLEPTSGYAEQVYFFEPIGDDEGGSLALLKNSSGDKAVSVQFNVNQLPCFSLWKCTQAEADGYVTGLEPATNYPNFKAFEREYGRVIELESGGKYSTALTMGVHLDIQTVQQQLARIELLQTGNELTVLQNSGPPYCA